MKYKEYLEEARNINSELAKVKNIYSNMEKEIYKIEDDSLDKIVKIMKSISNSENKEIFDNFLEKIEDLDMIEYDYWQRIKEVGDKISSKLK